jgi:hypothetical protein
MQRGGGRRGIAPLILTRRRAIRRLAAYNTPRPLYPREESPESTENEPGWAESQCGCFELEKNTLPIPGFESWILQSEF